MDLQIFHVAMSSVEGSLRFQSIQVQALVRSSPQEGLRESRCHPIVGRITDPANHLHCKMGNSRCFLSC